VHDKKDNIQIEGKKYNNIAEPVAILTAVDK